MAGKIVKKPKADAENTEVVENAEVAETTKAEETKGNAEFNVPTKVEQKAKEENTGIVAGTKPVKVCPVTNYDCCIGGTYYHLKKGVIVEVPQNVKDILQRGDMLRPF